MGRFCYINGKYARHYNSEISVDDRGLQFGDAVYEVFTLMNGAYIDYDAHMDRLEQGLTELGIPMPFSRISFKIIVKKLIEKNKLKSGLVYFQISRGTQTRDHLIPQGLRPNVFISTKDIKNRPYDVFAHPITVISCPDNRWERVDLKTIMLLPNCIAKTKAYDHGAGEAILVNDKGIVTEACSANFSIITKDGVLVTHPQGNILMGITRQTLLQSAKALNIPVQERFFTLDEAKSAKEAFISSASRYVTPVCQIDDTKLPADMSLSKKLLDKYFEITSGKIV